MDIDQAIRYLEKKYPGIKIKNFKEDDASEDPKGGCNFELELNGGTYRFAGHLRDFQTMNKLFEDKVKKLFNEKIR